MSAGIIAGLAVLLVIAIAAFRRRHRPSHLQFDKAQLKEFKREWDAANPVGPPLGASEIAAIRARINGLSLPGAKLVPDANAEIGANGNRLSGPAWLERGEDWPVDKDGKPMLFLAQIDYSTLPPIADFPERGLLQFFIGDDDLFGMDLDSPDSGNVRLVWRPDGLADPVRHANPRNDDMVTPLSGEALEHGVALAATAANFPVSYNDWRAERALEGLGRREGYEELEEWLWSDDRDVAICHHAGGNPAFVQNDVRSADRFADYDLTLLRLTSDDHIMWGDVGEAVFLIRGADLVKRDFSRVIYSWDCS